MTGVGEVRRAVAGLLVADLADLDGGVSVFPGPGEYGATMGGGLSKLQIVVRVAAGEGRLEELMSGAVKAAVDGDAQLGGLVTDASVTRFSGLRTVDGRTVCDWTVEVIL